MHFFCAGGNERIKKIFRGTKDGEFGYWQGGNSNSRSNQFCTLMICVILTFDLFGLAWDNRMATETLPDSTATNTWDNRMADHLNSNSRNRPQQSSATQEVTAENSSEWNNTSASDEWNLEGTEWVRRCYNNTFGIYQD